jgi:nucleotide-binding universal stress UspA family protein
MNWTSTAVKSDVEAVMSSIAMQPETTSRQICFRRILVGTDFSEPSRRALAYALLLARRYGSEIKIVHAIPPEPHELIPLDPLPSELNRRQLQAKAEVERLEQEAGNREVRHAIEIMSGDVSEVMASVIDRDGTDLLVLGTRGRGGLKKFALGSVAEQAVRLASCPVLTVGPRVRNPEAGTFFKSILFATDFGAASTRAFPLALGIAEEYGSKLALIHMLPPMSFADIGPGGYGAAAYSEKDLVTWHERLREESVKKLQALIPPGARLAAEPVYIVETNFLPDGILEAAAVHSSDLIVMGANQTRSARMAAHLPFAVLHEIICKAGCPVLTVRG